MKWKPIETAPRDGTWIILAFRFGYEDKRRISDGCWRDDGWHTHNEPLVRATHWMPRPPVPGEITRFAGSRSSRPKADSATTATAR